MNKMQNVIIIGAGGHAKVIADIICKLGDNVYGFLDDNKEVDTYILNSYKIIGKVSDLEKFKNSIDNVKFIIGIGNNKIRKEISQKYELEYYTAVHPTANIGMDVSIGEGTVVMPYACINVSSKLGKHCIINTGAVVEHENIIGDFVHISPHAALAGQVTVEEGTHIGINATVKNNIKITNNCIIGAGAVVVKNIEKSGIYIGVPAKLKE